MRYFLHVGLFIHEAFHIGARITGSLCVVNGLFHMVCFISSGLDARWVVAAFRPHINTGELLRVGEAEVPPTY